MRDEGRATRGAMEEFTVVDGFCHSSSLTYCEAGTARHLECASVSSEQLREHGADRLRGLLRREVACIGNDLQG